MALVTTDEALNHCRADAAGTVAVQRALASAIAAAQRFISRTIYETSGALTTARAAVGASLVAANAAYTTAVDAANALGNVDDARELTRLAKADLMRARTDADSIHNGIAVTEDIRAAILLLTGHFYRNREEEEVGANAAAVPLTMGARALLTPYINYGHSL